MNEKTLSIIIKAQDRASHVMEKVGGAVKTAMKTAAVATAAAGVAFATFGVKSASDLEQTRIGLENMLGSAENARKVLGKVSAFAAKTPFEFPELASATKQLVAFGFTGEDAFNTMKQLGDVSAAIGAPIGDLSYLMGTLRTQGRAFTIDIRQFAQRGVPIYEYLAKAMGTTEEAMSSLIEEGKVGFPEVQKAFQLMTEEGGKFHGAMEKQSMSLSGLFSTLKDNIGQAARQFIGITEQGDVQKGSIFDTLRNSAQAFITALPGIVASAQEYIGMMTQKFVELGTQIWEYLGPKIMNLWSQISEHLMPALSDLWHNVIEPLIPVLGELLVGAIGLVIDAASKLVEGFGYVYAKIKEGDPFWVGLLSTLAIVSGALALSAGVAAFKAAMTAITVGTIPAVMSKFTALAALITSPIVMPAIAVGAAIAALWAVKRAADEAHAAVQNAVSAADAAHDANWDAIQRIKNSSQSAEWKSRKIREISEATMNAQPGWSTGGYTGRGGTNEVAGIVHKGEYVVPKKYVDQNTGMPMMGGGFVFNMYGDMKMDTDDRVNQMANRIMSMMDAKKEMGTLGSGV